MLILFTDTDNDLTPKAAEEYGYHLISMPYCLDGKNVYPYEDFEVFNSHEYYEKLRNGSIPTTSALTEQRYIDYFEPYFAAGDDILYAHFSGAMSSTFSTMDQTVKKLLDKYSKRKFYSIDLKSISIASHLILAEISNMYKNGKSAEEIVEWVEQEKEHFAAYFFVDDLTFLKHSGRLSGLSGVMGTLLGIRPIIHINSDGMLVSIGKEKGRNKAIDTLVRKVEELGDHIQNYKVIYGSSDARELADELAERLKERFGNDLPLEYAEVGPVVGGHAGPNTVAVCFHAIHR